MNFIIIMIAIIIITWLILIGIYTFDRYFPAPNYEDEELDEYYVEDPLSHNWCSKRKK